MSYQEALYFVRRKSTIAIWCMALLLLLSFVARPAHAEAINLTAPSSNPNWVPVLVGDAFDPRNDRQATSAIDLTGNANYPFMYMWYDDQGDDDPDNDEVALRYRVANARQGARYNGYLWIGRRSPVNRGN